MTWNQTERGHGPIIVLEMARVRQNGESSFVDSVIRNQNECSGLGSPASLPARKGGCAGKRSRQRYREQKGERGREEKNFVWESSAMLAMRSSIERETLYREGAIV